MRVALVSELFAPPYDEGFKKAASQIAAALGRSHEVFTLKGGPARGNPLLVRSGFLWCLRVGLALRRLAPASTLYIPAASVSFFSFVRAAILRSLSPNGKFVVVGLQPRTYAPWQARFLPLLKPDLVLLGTRKECEAIARYGIRAATMPLGIDLSRFRPADEKTKTLLRKKYGFPRDRTVVLHVGHLTPGRNLEAVANLGGDACFSPVIVASTSTTQDPELKEKLAGAGVRILNTLVSDIEEVYQASDVYLFPVQNQRSAIDFPLSVLEAMGCGLPVVTTAFGALPEVFRDVPGLHFWDGNAPLSFLLEQAARSPVATRQAVQPYSWDAVARTIEERLACAE